MHLFDPIAQIIDDHWANDGMIRVSLRYWVEEMHVDGFRFDLASVLARDSSGHVMPNPPVLWDIERSEEHTSELQSRLHLVCRLLLEKKKKKINKDVTIA